jgi:hypothetical protein
MADSVVSSAPPPLGLLAQTMDSLQLVLSITTENLNL